MGKIRDTLGVKMLSPVGKLVTVGLASALLVRALEIKNLLGDHCIHVFPYFFVKNFGIKGVIIGNTLNALIEVFQAGGLLPGDVDVNDVSIGLLVTLLALSEDARQEYRKRNHGL